MPARTYCFRFRDQATGLMSVRCSPAGQCELARSKSFQFSVYSSYFVSPFRSTQEADTFSCISRISYINVYCINSLDRKLCIVSFKYHNWLKETHSVRQSSLVCSVLLPARALRTMLTQAGCGATRCDWRWNFRSASSGNHADTRARHECRLWRCGWRLGCLLIGSLDRRLLRLLIVWHTTPSRTLSPMRWRRRIDAAPRAHRVLATVRRQLIFDWDVLQWRQHLSGVHFDLTAIRVGRRRAAGNQGEASFTGGRTAAATHSNTFIVLRICLTVFDRDRCRDGHRWRLQRPYAARVDVDQFVKVSCERFARHLFVFRVGNLRDEKKKMY